MSTQADTSNATWPDFIPLPRTIRHFREGASGPALVRRWEDLPSRLFMGTLHRPSVRLSPDNWAASYVAAIYGTGCDVEYRLRDDTTTIRWKYAGELIATSIAPGAETFCAALRGFPRDVPLRTPFVNALRAQVERRFNAFVPEHAGPQGFVYYPDGFLMSLFLPVPVAKLCRLPEIIKRIDRDSRVGAIVSGHLERRGSVVNYLEGRNGPPMNQPLSADAFMAQVTGMPVARPSEWDASQAGSRALSVRRTHYLLHLDTFLPDVELVLEHLRDAGLVGTCASCGSHAHPAAHEFAAIIVPADMVTLKFHLYLFDSLRTRQLVYSWPIRRAADPDSPPFRAAPFKALVRAAGGATGRLFAQLAL